jgi:hypothetical protein
MTEKKDRDFDTTAPPEPPPDGGYRYPWDNVGLRGDSFAGLPLRTSDLTPPDSLFLVSPSGSLPPKAYKKAEPKAPVRTARDVAVDRLWGLLCVLAFATTVALVLLLATVVRWTVQLWL